MMPPTTSAVSPPSERGRAETSQPARLTGKLTTFDIVFTVLAFNAPLSSFIGFVPVVIGYGNGFGAPLTILAAGAVILLFASGFTSMSRHLQNPGAFYAYITAGLGKPLGLGAAFVAIVAYIFLYMTGLVYGGISLNSLVRDVFNGPELPWWPYTLGLIAVVCVFGYFQISLSARVLTGTMIVELIIVAVWDFVALGTGGPEGVAWQPMDASNLATGAPGLAIIYGLSMFSGFEATAVFREEARSPEKTIPRATYITIAVIAVVYSISAFALITGIGPSTVVQATATDPVGTVLTAVSQYLGVFVHHAVIVMLVTSIFAANIATHNVTARYIYSLSIDRVFPAVLGRVHVRHGSPHNASFITTAIAVVFVFLLLGGGADAVGVYASLGGISGYAVILLLVLTSCSVMAYFRRHNETGLGTWKTVLAPIISGTALTAGLILATLNIALLVGGSQDLANLLLFLFYGLLLLGILVALILRRRNPEIYARIGRQEI
jgi:amino acid transporter